MVKKSSDLSFDATKQAAALRGADPESDANEAFQSGDLRLIANQPVRPRALGTSNDDQVYGCIKRHGFKIICVSNQLLEIEDFQKAKLNYEENYNKILYGLIQKSSK